VYLPMREIWIPEFIAVIFLFFSLVQPFFKVFWGISGLVWLSPAALLVITGLFPAYGWRPECVPLLVFAFVFTMISIPSMICSLDSHEEYRERSLFITVPCLVFFAFAVFTAFFFSPKTDRRFAGEGVQERTLYAGGTEYFLRIYGPVRDETVAEGDNSIAYSGAVSGIRPVLFLVPPEWGSVPAADAVCADLRDRGFTVISYSRRGFDSPAAAGGRTYPPSPLVMERIWRSFRYGTVKEKANRLGRALETGRIGDLVFLLPEVIREYLPPDSPLFLAGYGAGGAAVLYLSGNREFTVSFPAVKGIIVIESRLWSLFRIEEKRLREIPEGASWFRRSLIRVENWFAERKPGRLIPDKAPVPAVPALFLMSDRILDRRPGRNSYAAVYETLRGARRPAVLATLEGAGPLDYTAYPLTHPVYRILFPGMGKSPPGNGTPAENAVTVITNFAALTAENTALDRRRLEAGLHTESRSWTLPDLRGILTP
jgi:hypothetical protein